jgi:hypothetical protein
MLHVFGPVKNMAVPSVAQFTYGCLLLTRILVLGYQLWIHDHLLCLSLWLPKWEELYSLALQPILVLGALCLRFLEHTQLNTYTHIHAHTYTHTPGRPLLNEWSACRRGRYLHTTQQTQQTNIHAFSGIRNRDSSNQAAADLRLRPQGHRVWRTNIYTHTYTHTHTCLRARACGRASVYLRAYHCSFS